MITLISIHYFDMRHYIVNMLHVIFISLCTVSHLLHNVLLLQLNKNNLFILNFTATFT